MVLNSRQNKIAKDHRYKYIHRPELKYLTSALNMATKVKKKETWLLLSYKRKHIKIHLWKQLSEAEFKKECLSSQSGYLL